MCTCGLPSSTANGVCVCRPGWTGSDCGVLAATLRGAGGGAIAAVEVDTFGKGTEWDHVTELVLSPAAAAAAGASLRLQINATGAKNPIATNSYVQIVGVLVDVDV